MNQNKSSVCYFNDPVLASKLKLIYDDDNRFFVSCCRPAVQACFRSNGFIWGGEMIQGYATAEATAALAGKRAPMAYGLFGKTALTTSQAGFGCYRITPEVALHRQSLRLALLSGINLIDTSTNYADGDSESLVGSVLAELVEGGSLRREELVVVSKVGYLQGKNYSNSQARRAANQPFPELVTVSEGLEHCIHPEFIESQLTESLSRLGLATLDAYLLHNPEYYLGLGPSERHGTGCRPPGISSPHPAGVCSSGDRGRAGAHLLVRRQLEHLSGPAGGFGVYLPVRIVGDG